jgi:hypothetical protein
MVMGDLDYLWILFSFRCFVEEFRTIFYEAGKYPDVMEVFNICVITGRMNGRKFLINFYGTSSRPIAFELI